MRDLQSISITSARELLKDSQRTFKLPSIFNEESFRQCANGFFQAEGHISCRIRGKYFLPNFSLVQIVSAESLDYFLTLWHVLGRTSNLTITMSSSGLLIIRLSSEN